MKAYVKIQSDRNITVTCGLQFDDVTNLDANVENRLRVNPLWPTSSVDIRQGNFWYPSVITTWNSVKRLVEIGILTIGVESDTIDDVDAKETKAKLDNESKKMSKNVNIKDINLADIAGK